MVVIDDGMEFPLRAFFVERDVEAEAYFFAVFSGGSPAGDNLVIAEAEEISGDEGVAFVKGVIDDDPSLRPEPTGAFRVNYDFISVHGFDSNDEALAVGEFAEAHFARAFFGHGGGGPFFVGGTEAVDPFLSGDENAFVF